MNPTTLFRLFPWLCVLAGIGVQGSFMFTGGSMTQTLVSVVLICAGIVLHVLGHYRINRAVLAIVAIICAGFLFEAIGVATNIPFGEYAYSGGLGWSLAGVSLIVPLAWLMVSYPSWAIARVIVPATEKFGVMLRAAVGGLAMVAWDVFLDTQMVAAGNWGWANPEPSLIGAPGIPLTNYAGWFVVGVTLVLLYEWILARGRAHKRSESLRLPVIVYVWTWLGSIIANLTFWERPQLAMVGGIAMGAFVCAAFTAWCLRAKRAKAPQTARG